MAPDRCPLSLRLGERVLWSGRPDPHAYGLFQGSTLAAIGFCSFLFGCFVFFPFVLSSTNPASLRMFVSIFTFIWLLMSVGLIFSPYVHEVTSKSVSYFLTDQRAIIGRPEHTPTASFSIEFAQVTFIERFQRDGGLGDVYFFKRPSGAYMIYGLVGFSFDKSDGFIGIEHPEEVERLFWKAKAGGLDVLAALAEDRG